MSLDGYFNKVKPAARMPKSEQHIPDELGIYYAGRVLNGGLSAMEALRLDAFAVRHRPTVPYGEPDAVLRFHTGIPKR